MQFCSSSVLLGQIITGDFSFKLRAKELRSAPVLPVSWRLCSERASLVPWMVLPSASFILKLLWAFSQLRFPPITSPFQNRLREFMALNLVLYGPTTGKSVCYSVNVDLSVYPLCLWPRSGQRHALGLLENVCRSELVTCFFFCDLIVLEGKSIGCQVAVPRAVGGQSLWVTMREGSRSHASAAGGLSRRQ